VASPASIISITPEFLVHKAIATTASEPPRVRIRSLINERCVTCHNEGGDDTARLVPFDNYQSIAPYLRPEDHGNAGRAWLIAALVSLFPLATFASAAAAFTS